MNRIVKSFFYSLTQNAPHPRENLLDEKIKKFLVQFHWDHLIEAAKTNSDVVDCLNFLKDSRLLFTIRGYQASIEEADGATSLDPQRNELRKGITLDAENHPLILVEGKWMRWAELKQKVQWNPATEELVSKDDNSALWEYYQEGLRQQSPYQHPDPVHRLTSKQIEFLQNLTKEHPTAQKAHCCYLQIIANLGVENGAHVGTRLIDDEGNMHSFGFMHRDTTFSLSPKNLFSFCATFDGAVRSFDFSEFHGYKERIITTIPLTKEQHSTLLNRVQTYQKNPPRINLFYQNCQTFAYDLLRTVGLATDVQVKVPFSHFLADWIPSIPVVSPLLRKTRLVASSCLAALKNTAVEPFVQQMLYFPRTMQTLAYNLLFVTLGGAKSGDTNWTESCDGATNNTQSLPRFRKVFQWRNLFQTQQVHDLKALIGWMKLQPTTVRYPDTGPRFYGIDPLPSVMENAR